MHIRCVGYAEDLPVAAAAGDMRTWPSGDGTSLTWRHHQRFESSRSHQGIVQTEWYTAKDIRRSHGVVTRLKIGYEGTNGVQVAREYGCLVPPSLDQFTSECSLEAQALGLGPRSRRFDSCHSDQ